MQGELIGYANCGEGIVTGTLLLLLQEERNDATSAPPPLIVYTPQCETLSFH